MTISYAEFKEQVNSREFNNFSNWKSAIQCLEELYDTDKFVYFYPRNLYNSNPAELIIFLEKGYLIVKRSSKDSTFSFEENRCRIISKNFIATKFRNDAQVLNLVYDNGKEITLHNINDSNFDWVEEYTQSIRELYKII
ncbi:hypothetical protein ACW73O_11765 [Faecalibacterium prausnitzii]